MSVALEKFPSYIQRELNVDPPAAIDHAEDSDGDSDGDGDSDRYELWTFRIPVSVNVSELNGVQIDLEAISGGGTTNGTAAAATTTTLSTTSSGKKLTIEQGDRAENETFRVLVPSCKAGDGSSDSDDGDDETRYLMHPSSKRFSKHINVLENLPPKQSEAELAPSEGPSPIDDVLRKAYCHIPQRSNLKRRWMPPGNPRTTAREIPPGLVSMKQHGGSTTEPPRSDDDDESERAAVAKPTTTLKREKSSSPATKTKPKQKPSKRRRSDDKAATGDNRSPGLVSPPKKKRTKTEKAEKKAAKKAKKQAKKDKKRRQSSTNSTKREDDAISV